MDQTSYDPDPYDVSIWGFAPHAATNEQICDSIWQSIGVLLDGSPVNGPSADPDKQIVISKITGKPSYDVQITTYGKEVFRPMKWTRLLGHTVIIEDTADQLLNRHSNSVGNTVMAIMLWS